MDKSNSVIRQLRRLTGQLHRERRYRVRFLVLAFQHDLYRKIINYELWNAGFGGLGERQWDDCFEYGDAELVIADVIEEARAKGFLENVREYCETPEIFERWLHYADRQPLLF